MAGTTQRVVCEWRDEPGHLVAELVPPAEADGAVLLFVHGLGANRNGVKASYFAEQAEALGIGFCRFDLSCHGESSGSMRGFTLSRGIADVARMREWLGEQGYRKVVALGSSFGALAALWHEARNPGAFAAACLIAPAFGLDATLRTVAGAEGMALWEAQRWVPYRNSEVEFELGWSFHEELAAYQDAEMAGGLSLPMLTIHGTADELIPCERVGGVVGAAPTGERVCEVVLIDGGDHALTEHRERIWREVVEFVERVVGR